MTRKLKSMRAFCLWPAAAALLFLCSCRSPGLPVTAVEIDPVLADNDYLSEVVLHLYRWYMDETDVEKEVERDHFVFWLREFHPELDPGDLSRFGEIVIPELDIYVTVKKPDYLIDHSGRRVTAEVYKIVNVARYPEPPVRPAHYREVRMDHSRMREHIFRTRNQVRYPEGELLNRMREAVRTSLETEGSTAPEPKNGLNRIVHLSPISPVANEIWVFWESGRLLLHFSSDLDLERPDVWAKELPVLRIYDIDEQVVVSLDEVAGSNAYLTRDQVGRALYNCIILGRKCELSPLNGALAEEERQ